MTPRLGAGFSVRNTLASAPRQPSQADLAGITRPLRRPMKTVLDGRVGALLTGGEVAGCGSQIGLGQTPRTLIRGKLPASRFGQIPDGIPSWRTDFLGLQQPARLERPVTMAPELPRGMLPALFEPDVPVSLPHQLAEKATVMTA